jgi:hypothetical protein
VCFVSECASQKARYHFWHKTRAFEEMNATRGPHYRCALALSRFARRHLLLERDSTFVSNVLLPNGDQSPARSLKKPELGPALNLRDEFADCRLGKRISSAAAVT